jgi:hypothetical protein
LVPQPRLVRTRVHLEHGSKGAVFLHIPESVINPVTPGTVVSNVSDMHSTRRVTPSPRSDRRQTPIDLRRTAGYAVADRTGRFVGKVECPIYGTSPELPDALAVRTGLFSRHRLIVPADVIVEIDGTSGVIGLRVNREGIRSFL